MHTVEGRLRAFCLIRLASELETFTDIVESKPSKGIRWCEGGKDVIRHFDVENKK
tara:strand:+ start:1001 stop:1165 length:165 start_codon:yes stop_codon:yes gene_type:complete